MSQPTMPGDASMNAPTGNVRQDSAGNYQTSRSEMSQRVHVSLWHCIRSEYIKFTSLKSTWILLIINALLIPMGAALAAWSVQLAARLSMEAQGGKGEAMPIPASVPWQSITTFVTVTTIVVGIFGVMSITSEFVSTSIDATLTANPHRNMVLGAKAIVASTFTWCSTQLGILLSWTAVGLIFRGITTSHLKSELSALPWVSILGAPIVDVLFVVMAIGIGALCRSTVAGVFVLIAIDMFLPAAVAILSNLGNVFAWLQTLGRLMPLQLMSTFLAGGLNDVHNGPVSGFYPSWWQSGLLLLVWTVIFYICGAVVLDRRDIK